MLCDDVLSDFSDDGFDLRESVNVDPMDHDSLSDNFIEDLCNHGVSSFTSPDSDEDYTPTSVSRSSALSSEARSRHAFPSVV